MSDTKVNVLPEIPESIDNAIKNVTDLPSKSVGQTLSDCWFLAFGGISQAAEKKRIKYALELESFKNEVQSSISKVPESIRKEPSSQLVLSALENAKFCVEEKELRNMFTALLTASIDSTQTVHPSFAHIISQMGPMDARMMRYFVQQQHFPICDIVRVKPNSGNVTVLCQNVFIDGPESISETDKSLSISSLLSLGLIEIPSDFFLPDSSCAKFRESEQYISLLRSNTPNELRFEGKIVRLSNLGKLFASCCITHRVYGINK